MIKGKSILAIIPARGGSKGVLRKNIRDLCNKPLLAWTIEAAKKSKYIDRLILSSEDDEIIAVARQWGCEIPFIRPKELAQDDTSGMEPVLHAVNTLPEKYDYVLLLQVTSPLRRGADIDDCIEFCIKNKAKSCVSITESLENPYWMFFMNENNKLMPVMNSGETYTRRQDLPKVYMQDGALYMAETNWLIKTKDFSSANTIGYVMPQERSIDIDCEMDLAVCELVMKKNKDYF